MDVRKRIENRTVRVAAWVVIFAAAALCGPVVDWLPEEAAFRMVQSKSGEIATREEILVPANRVYQAVRAALVLTLCGAAVLIWRVRRHLPESVVVAAHGLAVGGLFTLARMGQFGMEIHLAAP